MKNNSKLSDRSIFEWSSCEVILNMMVSGLQVLLFVSCWILFKLCITLRFSIFISLRWSFDVAFRAGRLGMFHSVGLDFKSSILAHVVIWPKVSIICISLCSSIENRVFNHLCASKGEFLRHVARLLDVRFWIPVAHVSDLFTGTTIYRLSFGFTILGRWVSKWDIDALWQSIWQTLSDLLFIFKVVMDYVSRLGRVAVVTIPLLLLWNSCALWSLLLLKSPLSCFLFLICLAHMSQNISLYGKNVFTNAWIATFVGHWWPRISLTYSVA